MVKVMFCQIYPVLGELIKNADKHYPLIEEAISNGCNIIIFPELSLSGYCLRDLTFDVSINEKHEIFCKLLDYSKYITIIFGFVYEDEDCLIYNAAACLEDGEVKHIHKKVYLPDYTMFEEARYYASGNSFKVFLTKYFKIGILLCEDALHLSSLYLMSRQAPGMICVLANSPARGTFEKGFYPGNIWDAACKFISMSITTNLFFVNRVGVEDGVTFWGGSALYSPFGDRQFSLPLLKEDKMIVSLNEDEIKRARLTSPFYRDDRPDIVIDYFNRGN